nr:AAA family ATPase [Saprospiraceae bacterium]
MDTLIESFLRKLQATQLDFIRSMAGDIPWEARLIGIKGARGVGKTTLILQHIKQNLSNDLDKTLYVSLDDFWFATQSLHEMVRQFVARGGRHLFLDEVHKYEGWSQSIKNFYDNYPDLQIVFTGSSLLQILNARADLSRRALVFTMPGLSYREFIGMEKGIELPKISLQEILENPLSASREINSRIRPLQFFDSYLKKGYYPFYKEFPDFYYHRLQEVVQFMLEVELPSQRNMEVAFVKKIKQLLVVIAQSVPFIPNISKLSERIQINRTTLLTYLHYLEEIGLTMHLNKNASGLSMLQKPSKIYLENTNLIYLLAVENANRGNLRETFFFNQLSCKHQILKPAKGDFFVDSKYVFEVGGKNKTRRQISDTPSAFLVKDEIEYGSANTIPLWLFGFLY